MKFSEGLNSNQEKEQNAIENVKYLSSFIDEAKELDLRGAPVAEFYDLDKHYRAKFKKLGIDLIIQDSRPDLSVEYLQPFIATLNEVSESSAEKHLTEQDKENLMSFVHLVFFEQVKEFYNNGDYDNNLILDLSKNSDELYKKLEEITNDVVNYYPIGSYIKNFKDALGSDFSKENKGPGYLRALSGIYVEGLTSPILKDAEMIKAFYYNAFYRRGEISEIKEEKEIQQCVSVQKNELDSLLNVFENINIEYRDKEVIQKAFQNFIEILNIHTMVKSLVMNRVLRRAYGEMLFDILDKFDSKINKFSLNDQFYIRLQEDVRAFMREANYR